MTKEEIIDRARKHLIQMAPHVRDRESGQIIGLLLDVCTADEDIAASAPRDASKQEKPLLYVSVCYYPTKGEADLTWESTDTGERFEMTVPMTEKQGKELVPIIGPCVYYSASQQDETDRLKPGLDELRELSADPRVSNDLLGIRTREVLAK